MYYVLLNGAFLGAISCSELGFGSLLHRNEKVHVSDFGASGLRCRAKEGLPSRLPYPTECLLAHWAGHTEILPGPTCM